MIPRLRMSGVQKSFGPTKALKNVSFELAPGEVHALIGENGAGKSTLMKILSAACQPDDGTMEIDGAPYSPANPLSAGRFAVAMIYQELNLAPHLTVAENISLGSEPSRFGFVDKKERDNRARQALNELGHGDIALDCPVLDCTIAQQQIVEIARALAANPRIVVMDEPTSSLTTHDAEKLFEVIARLSKKGVSIIYISHFLEECQRVAQRFTVLRDGESVANGELASTTLSEILSAMAGRAISDIYPRRSPNIGKDVLTIKELRGRKKPRDVSFSVCAGEIFGLAGLIGAGRTETLRALFGLDKVESGEIYVHDQLTTRNSACGRLQEGLGLLSENRKEEGLLLDHTLTENMALSRPISRFGFLQTREEEKSSADLMADLKIKARSVNQKARELSGGNQQKVAIARLLHQEAEILLLDEPTRGIDMGSKAQIYELMVRLAAEGKAIVFVSSYFPELLGLCDRIGVMCRGELVTIKPAKEWTEHSLIAAAVGANERA